MKPNLILAAFILSILSMGALAAGSPMNESFTNLIALSNSAIESGKQGDKQGFIDKVNTALTSLKEQDEKGSSIRLQRASTKLKTALKSAKADNLAEGVSQIEEGIKIMEEKR